MKNKIKILFVIDALRQGGIRTSLLNLLANLDYNKYEVFLFCFHFIKDDEVNIPKEVHIIYPNSLFDIVASTGKELKNISIFKYFFRILLSLICKLFGSNLVFDFIFKTENRNFIYDVSISYTNNVSDCSLYFGSNKFVIEKVEAKKKITWLHANYETMNLNTVINNEEYNHFDNIICVSNAVAQSFLNFNILLKNKVIVIYNLIDKRKIDKLSNINIAEEFNFSLLNCITVMRLDKNKDPFLIIEIAKLLKKKNLKFYWRVLGDGPLFDESINKIKKNGLENYVKMYGYVENPYPYLKKSDLYISTSKSEGYSLSIIEALYLNLDILCGRYDAIFEVLDNQNGLIIERDVSNYISALINYSFKKNEHYIIHSNDECINLLDNLFTVVT